MRVKLRTCRVGDTFVQRPGAVIEVGEDEALRLIHSGQASIVLEPVVETAAEGIGGGAIRPFSKKTKRGVV